MKFLLFLPLFLMLSPLTAFSGGKMNACFVTINSSEEKHVFKQSLSTGSNAGKFDFHELIPEDPAETGPQDWFEMACKKNIRCDVLVVSGHFGGSFFGESGYNLSMDELEKRSCRNDCKGVMEAPKEVFLLGCNTLAGKTEDNRSAAEYLDVLVEDDIPIEQASRIVEQRYGSVGTSFKDSMKRAFKGVPHIYGFHSVGPSGRNIKGMLEKYHKEVPDYYGHLLKMEVERGLALMGEFEKWNQKNKPLAEALRVTYFAQTSGVLLPCQGFSEESGDNDPNREILNNICKLKKGDLSEDEQIDHITQLLLRDDFELYMPSIDSHLENNYHTDQFLTKFKDVFKVHPVIKEKILTLMNETKTGFGKLKIAKIAKTMNIISKKEFNQIEKDAILQYLIPPVSIAAKDAICSYTADNVRTLQEIKITKNDFKKENFSDANSLQALMCLRVDDMGILEEVMKTFKNSKNPLKKYFSINIISKSKNKSEKFIKAFQEMMLNGDRLEQTLSTNALILLGAIDNKIYKKFNDILSSSNTIDFHHMGKHPEAFLASTFISEAKFKSYTQFKGTYTTWKNNPSARLHLSSGIFAPPLSKLKTPELLKFFDDKDFISSKDGQHIANNICSGNTSASIFDGCLSIDFDEHKGNERKRIDFLTRLVDFAKIENKNDETMIVEALKRTGLSKDETKHIIDYLPRRAYGTSFVKWLTELTLSEPDYFNKEIATYLINRNRNTNLSPQEKKILTPLLDTKDGYLKRALEETGVKK